MEKYFSISLKTPLGSEANVCFGSPSDEHELEKMYRVRYEVYSSHGYIYEDDYPDRQEIDRYDREKRCDYMIAMLDDSVIGSVRIVHADPLPIMEAFEFKEPEFMARVSPSRKVELSRLIVKKHKLPSGEHLPHHLVMLGLIKTLVDYSYRHSEYVGGYAFVKSTLRRILTALKMPVHRIDPYKQIYRERNLHKYFHQENDPVVPICYYRDDFRRYVKEFFDSSFFFDKRGEGNYVVKK